MKPSGYTKDGRPYWWVAGLLFYNRERAEHAAQEVAHLYQTGQNNGD